MADGNTSVNLNQCPASPQIQVQSGNIRILNEDDRQIQIFQNCTVQIGSSNVPNVKMRNCGNHAPRLTSLSLFLLTFVPICNSTISYSDYYPTINGSENHTPHFTEMFAYLLSLLGPHTLTDYAMLLSWTGLGLAAISCLVLFMDVRSWICSTGERT